MVKLVSKQQELIEMIESLDILKTYQKFEKIINGDKELKRRFGEMKAIQKQLVNAKTIQKPKAESQFQAAYDELRQSIETDPMIETYLDLQQELNSLLIEIKEIIENEINSALTKYQIESGK